MEPKIPAARPSSDESAAGAATKPATAEPAVTETAGETAAEPTGQAGGVTDPPTEPRAPRATGTVRARAAAASKATPAAKTTATTPAAKTTVARPAAKGVAAARATPAKAAAKATHATPAATRSAGGAPSDEPTPVSVAAPVEPAEPALVPGTEPASGPSSEPVTAAAASAAVTPAATVTRLAATAMPAATVAPVPAPLWERLRANPRYAPELLAVAAVQVLGGQVESHARWLAATYPHATGDSIARYAARRYARQAGYASLAGTLTRPWGALAGLVAYTWVRARLVLLTAAAYGHDPRDPERAAELLVLLGVHPDLPAARAALDAARNPRRSAPAGAAHGWLGLAKALAAPLGRVAVRRGRPGAFSLPGVRPLVGVVVDGSAAESLARRAAAMYRPGSRS